MVTPKQPPAVGIDLGTTFSVIAHVDTYGLPRTILNSEGDATLPSAVMFDTDSVIVGKEALRAAAQEPDRVARFVKREMGNRYFSRTIAGRSDWTPQMIQSFIVKRLKDDAEKVIGPFTQAVVTVPAYFNDPRRQATEECGKLGEIEVLDIINEPTAAALAYMHTRSGSIQNEAREVVLVYDLGGGTFDVSLVEVDGDKFQTLATDGDVRLGGCDWDLTIVNHIAAEYAAVNRGIDPREDPGTFQKLLLQAEDVKRSLSQKSEAKIFLDPPFQFRTSLTRLKFEELTEDLVSRTRWTTDHVREIAKLEWTQIDTVLIVGGSSKMPMIVRMLEELTGKTVNESVSKDEAIAWGAALYAKAILDRRAGKSTITIGNVNPHSLGVQLTDRTTGAAKHSMIIPPNQKLPAEGSKTYKVIGGKRQQINVRVFEGADAACQRGFIGAVKIETDSTLAEGERIEVKFRYESNARLEIHVKRLATGQTWRHELDRG